MADIKLYPHNRDTYHKIQEMWQTTNRVAVIQATGTGKSFLILKCLFDIPKKNKVVLAPSEYIFEQLKENVQEEIPNIQFITYMKLSFMTPDEIEELNPTLIILDEFHRCGAEEWGRGVQTLLNTFPNSKVLGTSATPIRYLDNERDMSDELFEGNVAVNLSLAEAIVKGILPMPKYISALYTFEDEVENLKNKVINSYNSDEEKDEYLNQIEIMRNKLNKSKGIPKILQKHLTQSNGKFIVFCKNKEHLHEIKPMVINWFEKLNNKIETYIVYTGYKSSDQEFEKFKNNSNKSIKLLFSIDMLNEGLHIDDITGVILLRPTVSPIIYYQQIGRAIDAGNINKPLIFDFVNNFDNLGTKQFINDLNEYREKEINYKKNNKKEEDIDIPEFTIWDEIKEVKDLFDNIQNELFDSWDYMYEKLKEFYLENNTVNVSINYNAKLYYWIMRQKQSYEHNLLSSEKIKKLNELGFKWDINSWEENYTLLKEYIDLHKNSLVPVKTIYKQVKLGEWCAKQRRIYHDNLLSFERIEKLNNINFAWDFLDKRWDIMYEALLTFYNEHKHLKIPTNISINGNNLYTWANTQRKIYKEGRLDNIKIQKLNNINFIWDTENIWEIMFNKLEQYLEIYNTTDVPKDYITSDGYKLGSWVLKQRNNKIRVSKGYNDLSQEKIDRLNSIDFIWDLNLEKWKNTFNNLVKYINETGNYNVPKDCMSNGIKLGKWIENQRMYYRNGKLSDEKIQLLKSIGFKWLLN